MKRTPWYPVSIDPVRRGHYECASNYWDGCVLLVWTRVGWKKMDGSTTLFEFLRGAKWRGLTKEHK